LRLPNDEGKEAAHFLIQADGPFALPVLQALGRLREAVKPMATAMEVSISQQDPLNAARYAINLSELYSTIGNIALALKFARRSVELADSIGDIFHQMVTRTRFADALHQSGQLAEAEITFLKTEELQKEWQPDYPILYSFRGFQYCDLLLGLGRYQEVNERATLMLELALRRGVLLNIALDNLSLARAYMLKSGEEGLGDYLLAAEFLQQAVDGLTPGRLPSGIRPPRPCYRRLRHGAQGLGDCPKDDRRDGLPPAGWGSGGDRTAIECGVRIADPHNPLIDTGERMKMNNRLQSLA
jgi:hypothetical protein